MDRLDKIVAVAAGVSRADARRWITRGEITVNGTPQCRIDSKAEPEQDVIQHKGEALIYTRYVYYIMNKPHGVLSATEDARQKTVLDLLPESLGRRKLFPVGRLDRDTTGLLLITDDGDFAHMLLSPKRRVPKVYRVELDGAVTDRVVTGFKAGVTLADGTQLSPAGLVIDPVDNHRATVTITEGKYHQIKRMFGVFELGVNALERRSFAGLELPADLSEGQARPLTAQELQTIKNTKILTK